MKKSYLIILLVLLLYGCLDLNDYYVTESGEIIRSKPINVSDLVSCDPASTNCVCMVCENPGFDLFNPFNRFYSIDLEDGECRFQKDCSNDTFMGFYPYSGNIVSAVGTNIIDMIFGPEQVHFFMFGQGSNFAEFADANRYCNNSLRLSVRWLTARDGSDYPIPDTERAECFLEKGVMPMYLLYSNGTLADNVSQAAAIASRFEGSGPVILSSEADFDPKNWTHLEGAIDQAIAMKQACPNCIIAISPRLIYDSSLDPNDNYMGYNNTYDAIDYIFEDSPKSQQALQYIDIVGVGLNSHYSQNCVAASLIWDAYAYSEYVLQKYEKPTIWAYVLMDELQPNAPGLKPTDACIWTSDEVVKTYSSLYMYVPTLVRTGVIGFAPYSLYGALSGPLECANCSLMDVDGKVSAQHTVWFSNCQVYYTRRGVTPIVYSPNPCADCSYAENYNMFQLNTFFYGASPNVTDLQGKEVQPFERFYVCNGQLMTEVPGEIDLDSYSYSASDQVCELYPELDIFSDIRDMDPVLTRAITWGETGLNQPDDNGYCSSPDSCDKCEASNVDFNLNAFPQCVTDPDGICTQCAPEGFRKHSMGLMQVHVYPEIMWGETSGSIYSIDTINQARWCAANAETGFNPFNKAHNACMGTAILMDKLDIGSSKVSSRESKLLLSDLKATYGEDSEEYLNMKNAYIIFISAYYYNGYSTFQNGLDSWIDDFSSQTYVDDDFCESEADHPCCDEDELDDDDPCCDQTNFINYYQECILPTLSNQQAAAYGLRLLGHYDALLDCDKYDEAQHEQNLIDYMDTLGDEIEEPPEEGSEPEAGVRTGGTT